MGDYVQFLAEDRRIILLRALADQQGYTANEALLTEFARARGHVATRDQIRGDLTWLAEQGLVSVEEIGDLMIAKVTRRGDDVANGRVTHPGVKRPSPEA